MATFKVTLTIKTNDYELPTKWLVPAVVEQLDNDEELLKHDCELVEDDE